MKNTKGQMHVLEVLLVGVLFTSAVNVAVNILPTSDADNSGQNDLYFSGMEILELLDNWAPLDSNISSEHNDSTLAWWLATDNNSEIKKYLDSGLPSSVSYRLEAIHGSQNEVIVNRELPDGEVSTSFRIVWSDSEIWNLTLHLWYGYREA